MADCKRKTANLFDEEYPNMKEDTPTYRSIYVGDGTFTLSTTTAKYQSSANLFFLAGNVGSGANTQNNGVWNENPRTVTAVDGYVTIAYRYYRGDVASDPMSNDVMLNSGSTAIPYEPYGWLHSLRKLTTATDTITTLPADLYADGTNATVGLVGNMTQTGTPTPSNPIQPSECGDLETTGEHAGQYKIPISSASTTTPVYLGEVQTTRRVKKLVLTGQETWYSSSRLIGSMYAYNSQFPGISGGKPVYCSHLQYVPSSSYQQGYITTTDTDVDMWIFDTTTSPAAFKQYLAEQYANGTPVIIWYVLTTPTTGIVNEPLRKIGNNADTVSGISIPTITGKDTVDILTTLKPSEVSLSYTGWHDANVQEWDGSDWK